MAHARAEITLGAYISFENWQRWKRSGGEGFFNKAHSDSARRKNGGNEENRPQQDYSARNPGGYDSPNYSRTDGNSSQQNRARSRSPAGNYSHRYGSGRDSDHRRS